ncbi:MCE family protein [Haloechinothrix sp. YIM 98757]|uniref:MCE family protein n=1 Tax=Haloechinothrix aidingensis TaxID=2752311 RepID=A0A838ADC2_9PSEU|nr:MCE family protein [Haloechinothrix aidingensis]MBA0127201.1 MCE family protein [Haloechinothrix aidingensis]
MKTLGRVAARLPRPVNGVSRSTAGLLVLVLFFAFVAALYNKERITNTVAGMFADTTRVQAEFSRDYQLRDHKSDVKMGGVIVGSAIGGEPSDSGSWIVTMQIDSEAAEKLGSSPSASVRPTLLLGGNYYVELRPGGGGEFDGETIPRERTSVPVELEHVLAAVGSEEAKDGIRASVGQLDGVLRQGGSGALENLLETAPDVLPPTGDVLEATRGTRPARDLPELVAGFQSAADALTHREGQLGEILSSLEASTAALAEGSAPLAEAASTLPETLRTTRAGLRDLQPTVDQLISTAESARPTVRELDGLLAELDPVLERTRPFLENLRPLLDQARPVVEQLVPVSDESTRVLRDVEGPVLDRLEGPISDTVLSPWEGSGHYAGGGSSGNPLYVELGYLASRGADALSWNDGSGGHSRLSAGIAANSVGGSGTPKSLQQYLETLGLASPGPHHNDGDAPATPSLPTEGGGSR